MEDGKAVDFFVNFSYNDFQVKKGPIAQLVEQRVCNAKVSGSNPLWSTIMSSTERWNFCFAGNALIYCMN